MIMKQEKLGKMFLDMMELIVLVFQMIIQIMKKNNIIILKDYIGQRWFNKKGIKPIFPFGYGLTYSKFEYSDLSLSMDKNGLNASFKINNNSTEIGQAVPMMFLTFPESIGEYPNHIFKGFEKVEIKPGETKNVNIKVDKHALSYFNVY